MATAAAADSDARTRVARWLALAAVRAPGVHSSAFEERWHEKGGGRLMLSC